MTPLQRQSTQQTAPFSLSSPGSSASANPVSQAALPAIAAAAQAQPTLDQGLTSWCNQVANTPEYSNRLTAKQRILDAFYQKSSDLDLSQLGLTSLPSEISQLSALTNLNLFRNHLTSLTSEIGQLTALTRLDLSINHLTSLTSEIGQLTALTLLDLRGNQLTSLPSEIGRLSALINLNLGSNRLTSLPSEIGRLSALINLNLGTNRLTSLPSEIGQLTALTILNLNINQLTSLTREIGQLTALTNLNLSGNQLTSLTSEIGQLTALTKLNLSGNHLTSLPSEIGQLTALTILILFNNGLTSLLKEISLLTALTHVYLSNNQLTSLPTEIGQLTALTRLNLNNNQLTSLPTEIGQLSALTHVHLNDNQLTSLPAEIGRLTALELFQANNNPLQAFPAFDPPASMNNCFLPDHLWAQAPQNWLRLAPQTGVYGRLTLEHSLPDAIRLWMKVPQDQPIDLFKSLTSHQDSSSLAKFLHMLVMTLDYRNNPPSFQKRVRPILVTASSDEQFRKTLFNNMIPQAIASCGDRVAHELDNIEIESFLAKSDQLNNRELIDLLIRTQRLKKLDIWVEEYLKGKNHPEEIQVSLFFRLALKEMLPIGTQDMLFSFCARISREDAPALIKAAQKHITLSVEEQAAFLCSQDKWTDRLDNYAPFQSTRDTIYAQLEEIKEDLELTSATSENKQKSLVEELNKMKIVHTIEILKALEEPTSGRSSASAIIAPSEAKLFLNQRVAAPTGQSSAAAASSSASATDEEIYEV